MVAWIRWTGRGAGVGVRNAPLPAHPLPGHQLVPGRAAQLHRDRLHRRGHVPWRDIFGTLLTLGLEANLANVMQALLYTLTTRLGAPGRDRYLLVLTASASSVAG